MYIMKQIGCLTLAIIISFTQLNAQKAKEKVDMAFEKTVDGITAHDFGSIVYGANGKVDFIFTNQGTKPISITNVESSCGCTVPTWTKEPVAPGKQGTVTVGYNTTLGGVFNKTVVVTSNANNSPVRLEIRGKVNVKPSEVPLAVQSGIAKEDDQAGTVKTKPNPIQGANKPALEQKPAVTVTKPVTSTIKKN